jgi:hypothetical protein
MNECNEEASMQTFCVSDVSVSLSSVFIEHERRATKERSEQKENHGPPGGAAEGGR